MSHSFNAACVLDPLTRTDITVTVTSADAWHVAMVSGMHTSDMDSRHPGGDAGMLPWPLPDGVDATSREAALDLLAWMAYHGERATAAGRSVTTFRPAALRLFVTDTGYSNPAYNPMA